MRLVDLKKWLWARYEALPKALSRAPVFVAVSGGMDSTVLAAVSLELRDRLPGLAWLHVNYHLRVPDSDLEEAGLRSWAKEEGVKLRVRRLYPRKKPSNLQAWARAQRLDFFRRETEKSGPALIWLAHHQSDQAETVLNRLLRGSGLKGVGGMSSLEQVDGLWLFRPFLEVPKAALKVYAEAHGLRFHHDRSNDGTDYLRNRLRHRVLPILLEENPQILEGLAAFGRRSRQAAEALEGLAESWLRQGLRPSSRLPRSLSISKLRRQPPALQSAILETWLTEITGAQTLGKVLPFLMEALASAKNISKLPLKSGYRVTISGQKISLSRKTTRLE